MIICLHIEINGPWTSEELQQKMVPLPPGIRQNILRKRQHLDVQLSVVGNLLILAVMRRLGLDRDLSAIMHDHYLRPYFAGGPDFNVSHAGNRVICCATLLGKVGVDLELIKPIDIDPNDCFTHLEQQNIQTSQQPDEEFFKYWTRKEALLKVIGTGVHTPLLDIDVSADSFTYHGVTYYLSPVAVDTAYPACIAHTVKQEIFVEKVSDL